MVIAARANKRVPEWQINLNGTGVPAGVVIAARANKRVPEWQINLNGTGVPAGAFLAARANKREQGFPHILRTQELCKSRGGRPGLSPSFIVLMASVDVKHHVCLP